MRWTAGRANGHTQASSTDVCAYASAAYTYANPTDIHTYTNPTNAYSCPAHGWDAGAERYVANGCNPRQ